MASSSSGGASAKFGTFGGVYTPSVLTILGVIMYLRLPWVVGQAGLYYALGIIAVAHIISISTGLSISSIATDKRVGAGGPYYIVSRSLGLSIGGALGLALFVGLSFSISLYIIGFVESFLSFIDMEATPNMIRITGSIVLVLLTILTFISTAFALKTQYVIFAFIAASLVSIFVGSGVADADTTLTPAKGGEPIALLFGIFFPAVTGFTAGVNMSGDLQNPRRAIPLGTMLAIVTGMVVYVGLAIFLALRVDRVTLIEDQDVLIHIAAFGPAVIAGIWGATLSSALGSLLGAPRILQATSADGITPRFFAKGAGPTKEPRRAMFFAFAIALSGILIAELDSIARIVSMVFLAMYGFLNLSCAIESWASPDFRPSFRIPRLFSLIGAVTCVVVMVQLDLPAMLGAIAILTGVVFLLKRRQLKLESGDTWEGFWSSLVRSGLSRLSQESAQARNWKPHILLFSVDDSRDNVSVSRRFAQTLVSGSGILTSFEPRSRKHPEKAAEADSDGDRALGVFVRELRESDIYDEIEHASVHFGFPGLEPNTMMLAWRAAAPHGPGLLRALASANKSDLNVLLLDQPSAMPEGPRRIDVWWREEAGNLPFSLALLRFLTASPDWESASLRLLFLVREDAHHEGIRATARRLAQEARIDVDLRIIHEELDTKTPAEWIAKESGDATLTIVGLPHGNVDQGDLDEAKVIGEGVQTTLYYRASSNFEEAVLAKRPKPTSYRPPAGPEGVQVPELQLPDSPELADAATALMKSARSVLDQTIKRTLEPLYAEQRDVLKTLLSSANKHLDALHRAAKIDNPRKLTVAMNRAHSKLSVEFERRIKSYREQIDDKCEVMTTTLEEIVSDESALGASDAPRLMVSRDKSAFAAEKSDSPYLRRFKFRKRIRGWFSRGVIRYRIPIGPLYSFYFEKLLADGVQRCVESYVKDADRNLLMLGRLVNGGRFGYSLMAPEIAKEEPLPFAIEQLERLIARLEELTKDLDERHNRRKWDMVGVAFDIAQAFANDVERLDVGPLVRSSRSIKPKVKLALRGQLRRLPEEWKQSQEILLERAGLALSLGEFRHRIVVATHGEKDLILNQLERGAARQCRELRERLEAIRDANEEGGGPLPTLEDEGLDESDLFVAAASAERLLQGAASAAELLPERIETVEDTLLPGAGERVAEPARTELPVRQLMRFLLEADFVANAQEQLARVGPVERSALGVAQEVIRLINVQSLGRESAEADVLEEASLLEILEGSIDRLDAELAKLAELGPSIVDQLVENLSLVLETADAYDLTGAAEKLNARMRRHQRDRAVSGLRTLRARIADRVERASVSLIFRRSTAALLARRLRKSHRGGLVTVERLLTQVTAATPRKEVVDTLPHYYRQLFLGQSGTNESFWYGRENELAKAGRAVEAWERGKAGWLLITGDRASGKSALCDMVIARSRGESPVFRVRAPFGGSCDPRELRRAMHNAFDLKGSDDELMMALPAGSTIVIDDLELWWERRPKGLDVVHQLLKLLTKYADRHLFVLVGSSPTMQLLDRLCDVGAGTLAAIECSPMDARALQSIVLRRHAASGLKFDLEKTTEERLKSWQLARLFSSHFDAVRGSVGGALRSWVAHIERVQHGRLRMRRPAAREWEAIDDLRPEQLAIVLQLELHKRATLARLARITAMSRDELRTEVRALLRTGLVVEGRQQHLELNPFVHHAIVERMTVRELLA